MKHLHSVLIIAVLLLGLLFIVHQDTPVANASQRLVPRVDSLPVAAFAPVSPQDGSADSASADDLAQVPGDPFAIRPTLRISIPYGIDTPLPIIESGHDVIVSGHGGCTQDQQVTIALTLTQTTSGAVAAGQEEQTCTGEFQTWSTPVSALTSVSFAADPAEACGTATTYDGVYQTDTYDWCRDVNLVMFDQTSYLPMIVRP